MVDDNTDKVGRNAPCPCGSGKKYKRCHGVLRPERAQGLPTEIVRQMVEAEKRQKSFEAQYGKGKPIITAEFNDYRLVAVGNEIHYARSDKTKFFPDFLGNYVRSKLGTDWGNSELQKPLEERHQILRWYDSMCSYQRTLVPGDDGTYRASPNGATLSWLRLAYDLYLIKHNSILQERLLRRLRNPQQFQGARFELCVTASMLVAGFDVQFEDEGDSTRKHAEFLATHKSGLKIAVEAKSRHRDGVLGFRSQSRRGLTDIEPRVAVEGLLRDAVSKEPEHPYFVFIDVNLPYAKAGTENPEWFAEMAESVQTVRKEWAPGDFPANAVFFCNDPTHHEPEVVPDGRSFWCYVLPVEGARHALPDSQLALDVARATTWRTNIPNEYPVDTK